MKTHILRHVFSTRDLKVRCFRNFWKERSCIILTHVLKLILDFFHTMYLMWFAPFFCLTTYTNQRRQGWSSSNWNDIKQDMDRWCCKDHNNNYLSSLRSYSLSPRKKSSSHYHSSCTDTSTWTRWEAPCWRRRCSGRWGSGPKDVVDGYAINGSGRYIMPTLLPLISMGIEEGRKDTRSRQQGTLPPL
jgi:hypothetical protein